MKKLKLLTLFLVLSLSCALFAGCGNGLPTPQDVYVDVDWELYWGAVERVSGYTIEVTSDDTGEVLTYNTRGTTYYVMNAELRFPLAREGRRTMAQFALFADIGNSWNDFDDLDFSFGPDWKQFKAGVGVGLRFTTPSLPIRIDWGYGLNHKSSEDRSHFYFNISNMM